MKTVKQRNIIRIAVLAAAILLAAGALVWCLTNVHRSLTVELGEPLPEPSAFLRRGGEASYVEAPEIDPHHEASYELSLQTSLGRRHVTLETRDTTSPTAEDAALNILPGEEIPAERAVKNIVDASAVTAEWAEAPELSVPGEQTRRVLLRDEYGNERVIPVTVTVAAVVESVAYVIGEPLPEAGDFVESWTGDVTLVTDFGQIDWATPGTVPVTLRVGGREFASELCILDRQPPEFTLLAYAAAVGEVVRPEDFVEKGSDVSGVSYSFETPPDTSAPGTYQVMVTAADGAGNAASKPAILYVCEGVAHIEAGSEPISPWQLARMFGDSFLGYSLPSYENFIPDTPGAQTVTLTSWRGDERVAGIVVRDTLPPEVTPTEVECYTGYPSPPEHFVPRMTDASPVTAEFVTEPDWDSVGPAEVVIRLTDALGHSAETTVRVNFVQDATAPEIHGTSDKFYYVGDAVSYFSGVLAIDNTGAECELTVDKSQVDYRKEGRYPVTYTAADPEGNSSSVTVFFTFSKPSVTEEELGAIVDAIFDEVLTDDMSLCEQAKAVYDYIFEHVYYIGSTDKSDWRANIAEGFEKGYGDCFTSCMTLYYMFDRMGIDVVKVERYHGYTRHYWVLANLGTGWYHVDACRANPSGRPIFMKTTAELRAIDGDGYFWRYDPALYPEVATRSFEPF
ncbi:MAG: hypothetical protein IJ705_06985 [Oscillospiraceae bacterium]|nr:hypothetical protein [Oscillospiraceae bacterium]